MTAAPALLHQLKTVSKALKAASKWKASSMPVDSEKDHFVFELLCYFKLAEAASQHFEVSVAGRLDKLKNGHFRARWPRSPGLKSNFSYLSLSSNSSLMYQLCPGVEVADMHGKHRSPDFTLQVSASSNTPSYTDLLGIWDAKYVTQSGKPVADKEIADFVYTFMQFQQPSLPLTWPLSQKQFQRSGVITNGSPSSEPDAALTHANIIEVSNFPNAPVVRP